MMKRIFAIIIGIVITAQMSFAASPFSGNAKTKRIPAGTVLKLKMLNPIDTALNTSGSDFTAMLLTDQKSEMDDEVILPVGSIIRGSVKNIVPSKRLSKGAILYLDFDHVVTPNGRQIPLSLTVTGRTDTTFDGGITTTKGYFDAWKQTCAKSADITKNSVEWASDVTDSGFRYVLIPVSAVGGAFGTAGYFVYDSIADLIRKGKDVRLLKDEIIDVILVEPIDAPVI
ncbi:hypothetical protein IJ596_00310 [bacterium]|nr:hypothetical protein [bacterium]